MSETIKLISIKGRFAYGVTCLEYFLDKTGVNNESLIQKLLERLWEYPPSNRLDLWEEKIENYIPEFVLNANFNELKDLTIKEIENLKALYQSFPKDLIDLIDNVIEIGRCNLYAGVAGFSECTLNGVNTVIAILKNNQIALPDLKPFKKFKFTDYHGWGGCFSKTDIE